MKLTVWKVCVEAKSMVIQSMPGMILRRASGICKVYTSITMGMHRSGMGIALGTLQQTRRSWGNFRHTSGNPGKTSDTPQAILGKLQTHLRPSWENFRHTSGHPGKTSDTPQAILGKLQTHLRQSWENFRHPSGDPVKLQTHLMQILGKLQTHLMEILGKLHHLRDPLLHPQ
jgi:hypothetical protein